MTQTRSEWHHKPRVLIWWSLANRWAPASLLAAPSIWCIAFFLLIPVWEGFYFYWMHRLLHGGLLYRFAPSQHRCRPMHPVKQLFHFATFMIQFVLPMHPVHVVSHLMFYAFTGIATHTGFEGLLFRNLKRVHRGMFRHQIHHRYFEVNYGNLDVPWDKLFGSFHDGTDAGKTTMRERLKHRKR